MEGNCEVFRRVLRPVEVEAGDELRGACERHGNGLTGVGEVGLPFRIRGAVDGGKGELAGLVLVRGGNGEALGNIIGYGGDVGNVAVYESEGTHGGQLVGGRVVVADLDGNRSFGVFLIGVHVRGTQAGDCGMGLVRDGGDWPSLPVERAVL